MNPRCLVVMIVVFCAATNANAARLSVELQCASSGAGPMLECTARLHDAQSKPLDSAKVTLSASMPSMPMAHTVKPVAALATGQPGEYRGVLQLEMPGLWAVQVDIAGPVRERWLQRVRVEHCAENQRCAAPAALPARKP